MKNEMKDGKEPIFSIGQIMHIPSWHSVYPNTYYDKFAVYFDDKSYKIEEVEYDTERSIFIYKLSDNRYSWTYDEPTLVDYQTLYTVYEKYSHPKPEEEKDWRYVRD